MPVTGITVAGDSSGVGVGVVVPIIVRRRAGHDGGREKRIGARVPMTGGDCWADRVALSSCAHSHSTKEHKNTKNTPKIRFASSVASITLQGSSRKANYSLR